MVKHIILWQLNDNLTSEEKSNVAAAAKKNLESLKGKIEGLIDIKVIIDRLDSSNADMMLDSTFITETALKDYSVHPAHTAVANEYVRPYTKTRSCLDFVI
ncbi:MAG: Dabb family protein [Firmicutes bacterium]|nr:Dabb family protein [Bacillota bacterium]